MDLLQHELSWSSPREINDFEKVVSSGNGLFVAPIFGGDTPGVGPLQDTVSLLFDEVSTWIWVKKNPHSTKMVSGDFNIEISENYAC